MIRDFGNETEVVLEMWSRVKGDNLNSWIVILIFAVFSACCLSGSFTSGSIVINRKDDIVDVVAGIKRNDMEGIKNLIIDLGGVLINLTRNRCIEAFENLGVENIREQITNNYQHKDLFERLELGTISVEQFDAMIFVPYRESP